MAFVTRKVPLTWGCMLPTTQALNLNHFHSIHTLSGGRASISLFNNHYIPNSNSNNLNASANSNIKKNKNDSCLFYLQLRTMRYRPKRLFLPSIKRKYKRPHQMKYSEFSDDTLHSINHGEDSYTKIKRSDYMNKHMYRVYPRRMVLRLWSDILDHYMWLPVSEAGLRQINRAGSLDRYILCTPCKHANSRLVERLRYRLNRVLERREDEIIEKAINDNDERAIGIAHKIITREEEWERDALRQRNEFLRMREGRRERWHIKWKRKEMEKRIQMIRNGEMPQRLPQEPPMYKQVQPFFNDIKKLEQPL